MGVTTIAAINWRCPLCGEQSEQRQIMSSNELFPPDLDLRPGEMYRSTIAFWVWRCPGCDLVVDPESEEDPEDQELSPAVSEIVASDRYRSQLNDSSLPDLVSSFLGLAMLQEADGQPAEAGWSALRAAWICDDEQLEVPAADCRIRAREYWRDAEERDQPITEQGLAASLLVQADVCRRAGDFDQAVQHCHRALSGRPPDPVRSLLEFELELVARRDLGAHSTSEVLGSG